MVAARTIRPGELTAEQLTVAPETTPERMAAAATREAIVQLSKGGGTRSLWGAMLLLSGVFAWHIMGDGTVREEARTTKVLVVWLVRCEHARQRGEEPPPFPYEEM